MAEAQTRPATDVRPWTLKPPALGAAFDICPSPPKYVGKIDSLIVYIGDPTRPSVAIVVGDYFSVLVDPQTDEVLGVEIDHFLSEAVAAHPELRPLLDIPGLPERKVKRARQGFDPKNRTQDAIKALFEQIFGHNGDGSGLRIAPTM
jgi:hypothetical protein